MADLTFPVIVVMTEPLGTGRNVEARPNGPARFLGAGGPPEASAEGVGRASRGVQSKNMIGWDEDQSVT